MKTGLIGNFIRIVDKFERLEKVLEKVLNDKQEEIYFESIQDTYKDIIGYSVIALYILRKKGV